MLLLLVRHAHAGDRDPAQWPDDRDRPLTDKGRKTQTRMARALRELGLIPEALLASPWTRATQTAEILDRELALGRSPVPSPALATDPDLDQLAGDIASSGATGTVALVGHSPWMEELGALLLTGATDGVAIDFPKSGVLGLEIDQLAPGRAVLRFFLRPKMV
jgi:phosphohistidine phosphatase